MDLPTEEFCIRKDCEEIQTFCAALGFHFSSIRKLKEDNRDAVFIYEFLNAMENLDAIATTFARNKKVHPDYAIEKLDKANRYIQSALEYFKHMKENLHG